MGTPLYRSPVVRDSGAGSNVAW